MQCMHCLRVLNMIMCGDGFVAVFAYGHTDHTNRGLDLQHGVSYWCSIVTVAVRHTVLI